MRRSFIIANWKSNKTVEETKNWFAEVASLALPDNEDRVVIICPPYPLLSICKENITRYNLPWKLGSQDVSAFDQGRHTGEVNSVLLRDFVEYVLIGHSERRQQLGETDELLAKKVQQAKLAGLTPFFFAQNTATIVPKEIELIVYEPPGSISPAPPDNPEDVAKSAQFFLSQKPEATILYGGNVTPENIHAFMSLSEIHGIIAGGASLDPKQFMQLVHYA